jgi:adenylate cyclase
MPIQASTLAPVRPSAEDRLLAALNDWLMTRTHDERFIDNIFVELCHRLRAAGVPVARATLNFNIQHPQFMGASVLWRTGFAEAELRTFEHGAQDSTAYVNSPVREIHLGAERIRRRLDGAQGEGYPIYEELRGEGLTDYVAWPIKHTLGRRHVASFAADRAGGFREAEIELLAGLLPALALVSEVRLKNRLARTLLETYVGPHASAEILAGAITRGSGTTVRAAILVCDLRDFTRISELWPRDDVIELLNGYFDAVCEPVEAHGGEILKFIGDGLLAIFPLHRPTAARDLLMAVAEAQAAMARLNDGHVARGRAPLGYGMGIHVGDVMYGNIGTRRRLDFTVIGPAVNVASRLEALTKEIARPVLLSRAFADLAACPAGLEGVGTYPLRGLGEPLEVLALTDVRCAME